MRRLNIRWTLTLWYSGVLLFVLAMFSAGIFLTMRSQLLERIDQGLVEELADVRSEIKRADDSEQLYGWLERRFGKHEGFDFQISKGNGTRFFVNRRVTEQSLALPEPTIHAGLEYSTIELPERGRWRIISEHVAGPAERLVVQVGRSLAANDHELRELLSAFLVGIPLSLFLTAIGGWLLAKRALRPVQQMTEAAEEISAEHLGRRIDVANPYDEIGSLAQTINRMIERLQNSFEEMRRFTADAAHELRTPLAVIRNEAEITLRAPRTVEEHRRVLGDILDEANRLSATADQLLFLYRNDAGLNPVVREAFRVDQMLSEVVTTMQLVGQEKNVVLALNANLAIEFASDPRQLRRVFYNLLDNAIKFTPSGGRVTVNSQMEGGYWKVEIADSGPGIAPNHLPRIFDRFYRADESRTGEGAGLGLSICRSIVVGLGGEISASSVFGLGTTMQASLPAGR
jgi:two-component system, OmpR family, heavy metal sensor histidine kinase CusS